MATYNGEKYLREQIDSILGQTFENWLLIIRDDGSDDGTLSILEKAEAASKRIILIKKDGLARGACSNFSELFSWAQLHVEFKYLLFADQDDVWLPEKIELSIMEAGFIESKGRSTVLIFSDFSLINKYSNPLVESISIRKKPTFGNLFSQNTLFGCVMTMNKAMCDRVRLIPHSAENHDYWVALVAVAYESAFYLDKKLVLYRKHSGNVTGGLDKRSLSARFHRLFRNNDQNLQFSKKILMLQEFLRNYPDMPSHQQQALESYLGAFFTNRLLFIISALRSKSYNCGLLQSVSSLIIPFLNYRQIRNLIKQNSVESIL